MAQKEVAGKSVATQTSSVVAGKGALEGILVGSGAVKDPAAQSQVLQGARELVKQLLSQNPNSPRVSREALDKAITELDKKISRQVDKILHNPKFQAMESAWRGLKFLVDSTDFSQNIRLKLLCASKDELHEDFEIAPNIMASGLYYHLYKQEYGTHGGQPYSSVIANYDFGPGARDVGLLKKVAAVSAMAHAPFIAAASPEFFQIKDYRGLPYVKDLQAKFEQTYCTAWNSFRDSEDARYVGLTVPRFLLRHPYGKEKPVKSFVYEERVSDDHDSYLWGNTAFAFASRLTESFQKYRWCVNIIGPQAGGQVNDLPVHQYESLQGDVASKIPTEVLISERREYELSEQGFISLTMRKGSDNACFFSANSCQRPKTYGISAEGKTLETNSRLGSQLPYIFVISRLAHYIKVIQRESLGSDKERQDLELELNKWINQYVLRDDHPQPGRRAERPLRDAEVKVLEVTGQPGWYKVDLKVRPHIKYMGAFFTLSLVGKLDRKQ